MTLHQHQPKGTDDRALHTHVGSWGLMCAGSWGYVVCRLGMKRTWELMEQGPGAITVADTRAGDGWRRDAFTDDEVLTALRVELMKTSREDLLREACMAAIAGERRRQRDRQRSRHSPRPAEENAAVRAGANEAVANATPLDGMTLAGLRARIQVPQVQVTPSAPGYRPFRNCAPQHVRFSPDAWAKLPTSARDALRGDYERRSVNEWSGLPRATVVWGTW